MIRVITFELPDPRALGIPEQVIRLGSLSKGLVLVTGPAGSGKSTTLACIIDAINQSQEKHIITMEDPLEYLHRHKKSIVSQREISSDTESYVVALRASLRQSPDVILLGEMRDFETISIAMTAAETGHLVFSTLHTPGAASTIDRIIDVFPPSQQRADRRAAVHCPAGGGLPTADPGGGRLRHDTRLRDDDGDSRYPEYDPENKIPQIDGTIYSASSETMFSMDASLASLVREGRITKEEALAHASNPEMLKRRL